MYCISTYCHCLIPKDPGKIEKTVILFNEHNTTQKSILILKQRCFKNNKNIKPLKIAKFSIFVI